MAKGFSGKRTVDYSTQEVHQHRGIFIETVVT